ncbi:MAG: sulfatase-like hydrolase/transferase [Fuerstiella sp.]
MNRRLSQLCGVVFLHVPLLLSLPSSVSAADAAQPQSGGTLRSPNVIIIYSDDHGYTDLGLFGIDGNVDTPNMDALARNGALMTNGYSSAPQCRPSRVGLMAGRIQNEFGFSENHADSGAGEGTMPRTYPQGTDMAGQPLLTVADRMKALGYVTGFSGKWHCGPNNDNNGLYDPRGRGFDEYWVGPKGTFYANCDLDGHSIPHQRVQNPGNRVIVQGKACESFIQRNKDRKFFLYFPIFGPHVPRIEQDDPYYKQFPRQGYPQYNDAQDDVRRQGLALLKAMDDSIGGVVQKLRDLGLQENTLILFCGDNGAPTKLRTGGGTPDINGWNGSENVPMRGNKGNLLEGGIRVPMFAYWKGKIPAGQVIDEMVTALDFTATTLAAGGGEVPAEFDGVNILPRLTGQAATITRTQPMFWDFFEEQAVRMGDWKLWRNGSGDRLFRIADDPCEINNVIQQHSQVARRLALKLD